MTMLEKRLNHLVGDRRVLLWETKWVQRFYRELWPIKGVPNPNWPLTGFAFMVVTGVLAIGFTPFFWLWDDVSTWTLVLIFGISGVFTALATGFSFFTIVRIQRTLRPALMKAVEVSSVQSESLSREIPT